MKNIENSQNHVKSADHDTLKLDVFGDLQRQMSEVCRHGTSKPGVITHNGLVRDVLSAGDQVSTAGRHVAATGNALLSAGGHELTQLQKGAGELTRVVQDKAGRYPQEAVLTGAGGAVALGCGAVAVTAAAPEIIGLATLGTVAGLGVAGFNAAKPFIKDCERQIQAGLKW